MLKSNLKSTLLLLLLSTSLLGTSGLSANTHELSPKNLLQSSWLSMSHPRFTLITDAQVEDARAIYATLAEFDFYIQRIMRPTFDARLKPVTIYAPTLRNNRALLSLMNGSIGFTHKSLSGNYIVANLGGFNVKQRQSVNSPVRTLKHEYIHYLTHNSQEFGEGLPLWLEEGLAEYWSTLRVEKNRVTYGHLHANDLERLLSDRRVSIRKTIATRKLPSRLSKGRDFYAHATLITHYLMHNPDTAATLSQFLKAFNSGVPEEKAFRQWVDTNDRMLRNRLQRHVKDAHRRFQKSELVAFEAAGAPPKIMTSESLAMSFGKFLATFSHINPEPFLNIAKQDKQYLMPASEILIDRLVQEKQFAQAELLLDQLADDYQSSASWLTAKANFQLEQAKQLSTADGESSHALQKTALNLLNRALSFEPDKLEAHFFRGIYYTDTGTTDNIHLGINSWERVHEVLHYSPSKYALAVLHLRKAEPDLELASAYLSNLVNTDRRALFAEPAKKILLQIREHQARSQELMANIP